MLPTRDDDAPAIIDASDGTVLTYRDLTLEVERRADRFTNLRGQLVFIGVSPRLSPVLDLLGLVRTGATVALVDASSSAQHVSGWVSAYEPAAVWHMDSVPRSDLSVQPRTPLPESVLLPTSGSTGSPKFVRLSAEALGRNARQIVTATRMTVADRALVHLPLHFSYGLSVLTSHLVAGATVVLTTESAIGRRFRGVLAEHRVTCLPGVPFSLELYRRTGLLHEDLPALRTITTSGGRVPEPLLAHLMHDLPPRGRELWCMYGQTEASGRISVLAPEELPEAAGSVGRPVPDCEITIAAPDADGRGDVVLTSPSAMLGYAVGRADLGTSDSPVDPLQTGDIGRLDAAGRLWLTGRRQRFAKVFGERVSLDDVEDQLAGHGVVAALASGDGIVAVVQDGTVTARALERAIGLSPRTITISVVPTVPRTASGKVDYGRLARVIEQTSAVDASPGGSDVQHD